MMEAKDRIQLGISMQISASYRLIAYISAKF